MSNLQPSFGTMTSDAEFSEDRVYRYALWRTWDQTCERVMFVGLNPSTADETVDDPTIRRCIGFAKEWGAGGLIMTNAYAFRATDPRDMKKASDPIGPLNDEIIRIYSKSCVMVIAAWGTHCEPSRQTSVCEAIGGKIYCLGKTKAGMPRHPLYLRADTKPELFWRPQ